MVPPLNESPIVVPNGPILLEGLIRVPEPGGRGPGTIAGVVICHPHPLRGGDMHNNVVEALALGLAQRGLATLCFNFRGVGAS